jgi:hypothetical protein
LLSRHLTRRRFLPMNARGRQNKGYTVADAELADLLMKISKAKAAMERYKRHLLIHPQMKGQLTPIVQGYQKLIADLEQQCRRYAARGSGA